MQTIKDIFTEYSSEYIGRFGDAMPAEHHKAIHAIINCRTPEYGITVYKCQKCGETHSVFRSCGNRHCPTCQNHKTRQWLGRHLKKQLPGHHFMITFTVPEQARSFIRSNQRIGYGAMFNASSQSLRMLAADERFIGGDVPGFWGVLHTWGRQQNYHPHIHYIVPGGAFSTKDGNWHPSRIDFFAPVKALSKIYKAKFRDEMKKAGMYEIIPPEVWEIEWNVNVQAVGRSEGSIKYLAPYVFKVAITNSRIVKVENRMVTFRYKKPKSNRWRCLTIDVIEFIRRFLQHVLPTGFMKIRYYGFMHPSSSISLKRINLLIEIAHDFALRISTLEQEPVPQPVCPTCGGKLEYLYSILPFRMYKRSALVNTG